MTVKRNRTLGANIGLATAVALAMGLAGCSPAHFDPNSPNANPAAPTTNVAPPANGGTTTPVNGGTNVTTPATKAAPMVLKGAVALLNGPMANAQLRIVDAITNKPLGIVAAGAGNLIASAGGNIVAAGAGNYRRARRHLTQATPAKAPVKAAPTVALVQTDAAGQFKLAVLGLAPGKVARIIATANGKTVTSLITGTGKGLDKNIKKKSPYVLQADDGFAAVNDPSVPPGSAPDLAALDNAPAADVYCDPTTSALDQAVGGMLAMNSNLKDPTAAIDNAIAKVAEKGDEIQAALNANPALADQLSSGINASGDVAGGDLMQGIFNSAGVLDDLQADFKSVAQEYAQLAAAGGLLADAAGFDPNDFAGLGVAFTADGNISIGGEVIDIPDANGGNIIAPPDDIPPQEEGGASDDSATANQVATLDHPVFSSGSFQPDAKIYYIGSTATMNVSQDSGEEDIDAIVMRFPGTSVFTGAGQTVLGGGQTKGPSGTAPLTIVQETNTSNLANFPDGQVSPAMGSDFASSSAVWRGYVMRGSDKAAYFQVFTDSFYTYVCLKYNTSAGINITSADHSSRLQTNFLTISPTAGNVEEYYFSSEDNTADRLDAVNTSSLPTFPAL